MFKKFKDIIGLSDLEDEYEEDQNVVEVKKEEYKKKDNGVSLKSKPTKSKESVNVSDNADLFIISPRRYEDCAGVIDEL
ncbi:MAG: hypothetical protein CVU93_00980, partial [Firmicutes bacterium HGW-Firmicutes-18]